MPRRTIPKQYAGLPLRAQPSASALAKPRHAVDTVGLVRYVLAYAAGLDSALAVTLDALGAATYDEPRRVLLEENGTGNTTRMR